MTRDEYEKYLHNLCFERERSQEVFEEVNAIYQKAAKYLQHFPFEKYPFPAYEALEFICSKYDFSTVLDVGCGEGFQSKFFLEKGKKVTAIDYGKSGRTSQCEKHENFELIISDFNTYQFDKQFDCVWAAHVLEHQLNPQGFLERLLSLVREGGIIAVTVPPYKSEIIGGHVSLWNSGLLLYRMILAGCDCRDASIKKYGYNISLVVRKKSIKVLDKITYDPGDIKILKEYFPAQLNYYDEFLGRDILFDGNFSELNWK